MRHPTKRGKVTAKQKADRAHAHAVRIAERKAAKRGLPRTNPATGLKGRRHA